MAQTFTLTKILSVRELEKREAEIAHQEALESFEEMAYQLYLLLRKKEEAEALYEQYIQSTMSIDKIHEQLSYIAHLKKQIIAWQHSTDRARERMNKKQVVLTDAHIEVKKFEKMIDKKELEQEELLKKQEADLMDDISIQQFMKSKH